MGGRVDCHSSVAIVLLPFALPVLLNMDSIPCTKASPPRMYSQPFRQFIHSQQQCIPQRARMLHEHFNTTRDEDVNMN